MQVEGEWVRRQTSEESAIVITDQSMAWARLNPGGSRKGRLWGSKTHAQTHAQFSWVFPHGSLLSLYSTVLQSLLLSCPFQAWYLGSLFIQSVLEQDRSPHPDVDIHLRTAPNLRLTTQPHSAENRKQMLSGVLVRVGL